MVKAAEHVAKYPDVRLIGPNCPGIITPGKRVGRRLDHARTHSQKKLELSQKSGTLTYEAVAQAMSIDEGQSTCVGIEVTVNGTGSSIVWLRSKMMSKPLQLS